MAKIIGTNLNIKLSKLVKNDSDEDLVMSQELLENIEIVISELVKGYIVEIENGLPKDTSEDIEPRIRSVPRTKKVTNSPTVSDEFINELARHTPLIGRNDETFNTNGSTEEAQ